MDVDYEWWCNFDNVFLQVGAYVDIWNDVKFELIISTLILKSYDQSSDSSSNRWVHMGNLHDTSIKNYEFERISR